MPGFSEQGGQRPSDYDEVLKGFRKNGLDRLVRLELLEMAEGGNPNGGNPDPNYVGVREDLYKGWQDEHFKQLLADLGFPIKE